MKLKIGIDSKTYEVDVEVAEEDFGQSHTPHPPLAGGPAHVAAPPPVALSLSAPVAPTAAPSGKVCRSPIVGLVTKVLVRVGQQLKEHDRLVVLEAMKMESNITAPLDGIVARINVKPGDAVQAGQVLVEFE